MICLDTHILIWGLRGFASRGQEPMIDRAERYIRYLRMKTIRVMVPTPVLSEYLVGCDATQLHERQIFEMGFELPPFDAPAAEIAANLARDLDLLKATAREFDVGRDCIKTDIMIIAIAVYRKAQKIVTNDREIFTRLASGRIPVEELPDIPANIDDEQGELF